MTTTVATAPPEKRKFTFPTAYTILALLLVVVAVLTFIIPAGRYDLDADGAPIPGTYHTVETESPAPEDALMAPINGMYGIKDSEGSISIYNVGTLYGAIDVALFILMIGGFLGVTMKTGAIDAGISEVVTTAGRKGQMADPDPDDRSLPQAALPTAWPKSRWPFTR